MSAVDDTEAPCDRYGWCSGHFEWELKDGVLPPDAMHTGKVTIREDWHMIAMVDGAGVLWFDPCFGDIDVPAKDLDGELAQLRTMLDLFEAACRSFEVDA